MPRRRSWSKSSRSCSVGTSLPERRSDQKHDRSARDGRAQDRRQRLRSGRLADRTRRERRARTGAALRSRAARPMVHRSMPELAEVEHSRRTWDPGVGQKVLEVNVPRVDTRVLRGVDVERLRDGLTGQKLVGSEARGKQMCFRFGARGERWLGIHLGMRGM
ncbi:MAG: hypothetical protein EOP08_05080, partial [Proteobacteria bacterium]